MTTSSICTYCGRRGHTARKCPIGTAERRVRRAHLLLALGAFSSAFVVALNIPGGW